MLCLEACFCEGAYACLVWVLVADEFVDTFWGFVL